MPLRLQSRQRARDRKFADSPLEGTGFEPSVPLLRKGLSAVAERSCRTDKLDGIIKHRSSRKTTVVGCGPPLHSRLFDGGDRWFESIPLQQRVCKLSVPL